MEQARAALSAARVGEVAALEALAGLRAERDRIAARREAAIAEQADWTTRRADAAERSAALAARAAEARAERDDLAALPEAAAARGRQAGTALAEVEAAHAAAAQALAAAEAERQAAGEARRAADAGFAAARETQLRAEGAAEQATTAAEAVRDRVLERFGEGAELPPPEELTDAAEDKARRRLERLLKEREEMGPVNLRADVEAEAVEKQIAGITAEREELDHGDRQAARLDRPSEPRGPRAAARHVRADRPQLPGAVHPHVRRRAGRIWRWSARTIRWRRGWRSMPQPPGKKLATLSLLSGGEQALTALSLIFAVFRCNPAPVCVLDEVDAPLDDANVERFCTLLEDMVRETATRFLVVTHHPLTMARMDRLYGVTMQERGVSRLLSSIWPGGGDGGGGAGGRVAPAT